VGKRYFGKFDRSLDTKGRLQVPPSLLVEGETQIYLLKGFEGCISMYSEESFNKLVDKLEGMDFLDENSRAYIRLVSASIVPMKLDAHGRITLGKAILEDYGISDKVTLIGVLDHFEIWDTDSYARYNVAHSIGFDFLAKGARR